MSEKLKTGKNRVSIKRYYLGLFYKIEAFSRWSENVPLSLKVYVISYSNTAKKIDVFFFSLII